MYSVYKQVWNAGIATQQLVATYTNESSAKQKALRLKGLVMKGGQVFFDFRS
jgi:hypothetical protein